MSVFVPYFKPLDIDPYHTVRLKRMWLDNRINLEFAGILWGSRITNSDDNDITDGAGDNKIRLVKVIAEGVVIRIRIYDGA